MLEYLRIHNLALIEDMSLTFADGLNVLTGETGAGKSFILKALRFLTGDKLQSDMIRAGKGKAEVEALFYINDEEYIIRREILAESGRSKLFINDRLASQETIKDLRPSLLVHTSQHAQHKLLQSGTQGKILDSYLEEETLFAQRDRLFHELKELSVKKSELLHKITQYTDKRELLEFQQKEIDAIAPEPNEEAELELLRLAFREREAAEKHNEEIMFLLYGDRESLGFLESAQQFLRTLQGIRSRQQRMGQQIENTSDESDESVTILIDALETVVSTIPDFERSLHKKKKVLATNGYTLEEVEKRLFQLATLKRKLKRSFDDIISLQEEIAETLSFLDSCSLDIKSIERDEERVFAQLAHCIEQINQKRQEKAPLLAQALVDELKGLGFSEQIAIIFEFVPTNYYTLRLHSGEERVIDELRPQLLWVPNPGQQPQPLDKIASGGELSRFLLALTSLTTKDEHATLIFDEIDTGVGGITLNHMAARLEKLASERQLLLITHWPQLAAKAGRHFQVIKTVTNDQTYTLCQELSPQERFQELVRMAGGGQQGEALAKELLLE